VASIRKSSSRSGKEKAVHNNYGDVALGLSADWSRATESNQEYALGIIGHENGEADVYLKDEPTKRHQFAFVDTRFNDEVALNRVKKYTFVKKDDGWVQRTDLWDWDAEGFLLYRGQRLMARPGELYTADLEKRKQRMQSKSAADEEAKRIAARAGIEMEEEGRKVVKRKRA
jgi:hypothetical protein